MAASDSAALSDADSGTPNELARLDAAIWNDDTQTMRAKLTPSESTAR